MSNLETLTDKEVMERYKAVRREIDIQNNIQMSIKIMMNSLYGAL